MFKNIGIILKKHASIEERSVVQDLIKVLAKNPLHIFAEKGTDLPLVTEKNGDDFPHQIDLLIVLQSLQNQLQLLHRLPLHQEHL